MDYVGIRVKIIYCKRDCDRFASCDCSCWFAFYVLFAIIIYCNNIMIITENNDYDEHENDERIDMRKNI